MECDRFYREPFFLYKLIIFTVIGACLKLTHDLSSETAIRIVEKAQVKVTSTNTSRNKYLVGRERDNETLETLDDFFLWYN